MFGAGGMERLADACRNSFAEIGEYIIQRIQLPDSPTLYCHNLKLSLRISIYSRAY